VSFVSHASEPVCIPIARSGQRLCITVPVLRTFGVHCQSTASGLEAGGVLLACFDLPNVIIEEVTVPSVKDCRSRFAFIADQASRKKAVTKAYKRGLHFIGEWHSHPQADPAPSACDLRSMNDLFVKSRHELNFLVMVIVGNRTPELSLWISLHDASCSHLLTKLRIQPGGWP
jgi:integrative and conjugative element protein (TIGR02256 family)